MIKLKDIITEAPEQETKKFIKTLKSIQSSLLMINKTINVKGKVNKLMAWKKHLANLEKKL
jgi:hypothetical protein